MSETSSKNSNHSHDAQAFDALSLLSTAVVSASPQTNTSNVDNSVSSKNNSTNNTNNNNKRSSDDIMASNVVNKRMRARQSSTSSLKNNEPNFEKSANQRRKLPRKSKIQEEPYSPIEKRTCHCKNSKCLKLYCECFTARVYCNECNCVGCHNAPETESQVAKAIEETIERNPQAFSLEPKHSKGCNCRKSYCLKKYCECYQAGIQCSSHCNCIDCKNRPGQRGAARRRAPTTHQHQQLTNVALAVDNADLSPANRSVLQAIADGQILDSPEPSELAKVSGDPILLNSAQVAAHSVARALADEDALMDMTRDLFERAQHALEHDISSASANNEDLTATPSSTRNKSNVSSTPPNATAFEAMKKIRTALTPPARKPSVVDPKLLKTDVYRRQEAAVLEGVRELVEKAVLQLTNNRTQPQ